MLAHIVGLHKANFLKAIVWGCLMTPLLSVQAKFSWLFFLSIGVQFVVIVLDCSVLIIQFNFFTTILVVQSHCHYPLHLYWLFFSYIIVCLSFIFSSFNVIVNIFICHVIPGDCLLLSYYWIICCILWKCFDKLSTHLDHSPITINLNYQSL